MNTNRASIPVSFFSIAVGLLALSNAWHVAVRLWPIPAGFADAATAIGVAVWATLGVLYARKWWLQRGEAQAEFEHPLQSSFAALAPVATMLAAAALLPYARTLAVGLFVVSVSAQLALGLWVYGRFWQGGRKPDVVTPAIYLPAVAQNFVAGAAAVSFGWPHLGAWFFGAGVFSWLAIESMILGRAGTQEPMPEGQRPILGIQLAPPVVGGVTYMALTTGVPDLFADMLLGYGLFQALLLLRLLPWIRHQPFTPTYWAFSFGVAALPTLAMRMLERGSTGPIEWLAPLLFVAGNFVIGLLAWKTLALLLTGRLVPASPAQPKAAA